MLDGNVEVSVNREETILRKEAGGKRKEASSRRPAVMERRTLTYMYTSKPGARSRQVTLTGDKIHDDGMYGGDRQSGLREQEWKQRYDEEWNGNGDGDER